MSNLIYEQFSKPIHPRKIIEGVCVCVNYADFLAQTLGFNRTHFDNLVIVTTPDDYDTINLCEYWNVKCVKTDAFYSNGDAFNKGLGINEGLKNSKKNGLGPTF